MKSFLNREPLSASRIARGKTRDARRRALPKGGPAHWRCIRLDALEVGPEDNSRLRSDFPGRPGARQRRHPDTAEAREGTIETSVVFHSSRPASQLSNQMETEGK